MQLLDFRRLWRSVCAAVLLGVMRLVSSDAALAQPGQQDNPLSFDRNIQGLMRKYCYRCHNEDEPNGGVDLQSYRDPRQIAADPLTWQTALGLIRSGEMPPEDARQPSEEERELIIQFIELTVTDFDCGAPRDPGTPTLRRLNRFEYDRSIFHLTGLELSLSQDFPEDAVSFGFRNIAQSLTLSPLQVQQYFAAARRVIDEVLQSRDADRSVYDRVFFTDPERTGSERGAAQRIIGRFATAAFRRDVDDDFMTKLMDLYDSIRERGEPYQSAVGHVLTAVLVSPRFLMRTEVQQPEQDGPYRIDDFDLASRLSFFLWSSPPDEKLLELARKGKLHQVEVLDKQVQRLLSDSRSDALVEQFFSPWLQLESLADHRVDREVFPDFNDQLNRSVQAEPRRLLAHLIRQDRPLTELIDADYTFINESLAKLYGMDDVSGDSLRQVRLADRRRGGLLTTAAVLTAQSDPGRTNVPRRGNFIAAAILGTAPPPPPPDVPELPSDDSSAKTLTLRERFEAHRADAQCSSCHFKIDPLGFALENYDAVGRWRDTEVGKPIDSSGTLPDGRQFEGPVELKDILLENKDALTRVLARQMLIYALGRGPMTGDDCVIDDAVAAAASDGYRLSSVVRAIVHSYPFLHTRNPDF
jgi:hypothetical protein